MKALKIGIVGAGALGTALAHRLYQKKYSISAVISRRAASARHLAGKINCSVNGTDLALLAQCNFVILTVSDSEIFRIIKQIQKVKFNCRRVILAHTSGAIEIKGLPLTTKDGACRIDIATMHPMQSFPAGISWQKQTLDNHFNNIYFGVDGHARATAVIKSVIKRLGSNFITIPAGKKIFYHLGGVVSSNFLIALIYIAAKVYGKMGFTEKQTVNILNPILRQTIENVSRLGIGQSLTGPAARNDYITLAQHTKAIKSYNKDFQKTYEILTAICLAIAKQRK